MFDVQGNYNHLLINHHLPSGTKFFKVTKDKFSTYKTLKFTTLDQLCHLEAKFLIA